MSARMQAALVSGAAALLIAASASAALQPAAGAAATLDDFESVAAWTPLGSDDVLARVSAVPGEQGGALRLDYDFHGHGGYATARRALPLTALPNFEITFRVRGHGARNDLQLKLVDASGDNVWWFRSNAWTPPADWQTVRIRRRAIEFAWGPRADHALADTASLELAIVAGEGGRGHLEIDSLQIRELPVPPATPPRPVASAAAGAAPQAAVDDDVRSAWRVESARDAAVSLDLDLGFLREIGGITLAWQAGAVPSRYDVQVSADGVTWQTFARVRDRTTAVHVVAGADTDVRRLRVRVPAGETRPVALADVRIEVPGFAADRNAIVQRLASGGPRGEFPRAWAGEQSYWTIVGADGGATEGMLSEDGAFELGRAAPSLEPFLSVDGRRYGWVDVATEQTLRDRYLPMPAVRWKLPEGTLDVSAIAAGEAHDDYAIVRYAYTNRGAQVQRVGLDVLLRPLQVNPPTQFLNGAGGAAILRAVEWRRGEWRLDGRRVIPLLAPDSIATATLLANPSPAALAFAPPPPASGVRALVDPAGFASGAMRWERSVAPGASFVVAVVVPWSAAPALPDATQVARWVDAREAETAARWHARLDTLQLRVPVWVQPLVDTMRTAIGHILVNRDGPRLQPGSRSYERSWIRDGALASSALLRMGVTDVPREFLDWYAPHQFSNGKIPCCVDSRGADPVPENDSPGQFVWVAAEIDRYTRDLAALRRVYPRIDAALRHLDELRATERTAAVLAGPTPEFYGLLPASISHEGYSAKPMHSYWDDFWALAGYEAGIRLARRVGDADAAQRWTRSRDEMRADVYASIQQVVRKHAIQWVPGAAELGDFDATSTTIALAPGFEQPWLPQELVAGTFERYWQSFVARRDARAGGPVYTPYEVRTIGSFVRLGWRERAQELIEYFMHDRRPAGWNQWAEVVALDPRDPRFIGDLPHGWIASDYVRAALDLFAYERESDEAIVLAAGVDLRWLEGEGISLANLPTPYGTLAYSLRREVHGPVHLHVPAGVGVPPGGFAIALCGQELRYASVPVQAAIDCGERAGHAAHGEHVAR